MANPLVPLGNLNRLKASVVWTTVPTLNVTASFLGKEGIRVTPEGVQTLSIPAMTGVVQSPEPYQLIRMTLSLLKSQGLADAYKAQSELNTLLGQCTVRPDVPENGGLSPFQFDNCSIENIGELMFSGENAAYPVIITGTYYLNSALWV